MTPLYSAGFLTPQATRIERAATLIFSRDVLQAEPVIVDWDYSADVAFQVDLVIDLDGIAEDIGTSGALRIEGALHWTASGSGLRGAGPTAVLVNGLNALRLHLEGAKLGGILTVSPRVVFKGAEHFSAMSPRRLGSTLWSDQFSVTLEGGGNRFPTLPVPFSQSGIAGGNSGAWALEVRTTDLHVSASSAISLYLNSEHPRIAQMLTSPHAEDSELILRFIEYDVTRQLLSAALNATELDDGNEQEPGTLGETLVNLTRRLFPGRTLTELRGAQATYPGELDAELQAVLDLPLVAKT